MGDPALVWLNSINFDRCNYCAHFGTLCEHIRNKSVNNRKQKCVDRLLRKSVTFSLAQPISLAPFAILQKATITFFLSVCPSVRMEQLGSHWMDFHEFRYLITFRRVRKISKKTINFFMSVSLSVRMEQLGPHWTKLMKFEYFSKICRENSSFLKI